MISCNRRLKFEDNSSQNKLDFGFSNISASSTTHHKNPTAVVTNPCFNILMIQSILHGHHVNIELIKKLITQNSLSLIYTIASETKIITLMDYITFFLKYMENLDDNNDQKKLLIDLQDIILKRFNIYKNINIYPFSNNAEPYHFSETQKKLQELFPQDVNLAKRLNLGKLITYSLEYSLGPKGSPEGNTAVSALLTLEENSRLQTILQNNDDDDRCDPGDYWNQLRQASQDWKDLSRHNR